MNEKLLISQDLSCVGQVSLSVALPILGACGYQPDVLPTTILSTHTGGFGNNTFLNLNREIEKIITHWQEENITFENLYLGYFGKEAIDFWVEHISKFKKSKLILLDPAMADSGKLYSGLDQQYVSKMRLLAKKATILTPNLTEACLLLKKEYRDFSIEEINDIALNLKERFELDSAIITGIPTGKKVAIVGVSDRLNFILENKKIARSFFGTGDMFASSLLAVVLAGYNLKESSQIAADFIKLSIKVTDVNQDKRLGPNYAGALAWLMKKVTEGKR
ncbi:PfkB family carbohydrate kinase [Lactobacillus taiwanensis]|uniref:PfkB family carbohydrate kinase n=1 Tax=Lactobacillus taiwanensis TaxID=508451 RepID=UPI002557DD35|nr:PfkB family carbohydrate kinase [Lactobacillus taiwanensis]